MLLTGNGALRVNLSVEMLAISHLLGIGGTHDLAIEKMFPDHYGIDTSRVLESQKSKTSRPARCIAHDRTRIYFAELREVISKGFCVQESHFSTTGW